MTAEKYLLSADERSALQEIVRQRDDIEGRRAAALLELDAGKTQAAAAEACGLTVNQVRYIAAKFRDEHLLAFSEVPSEPSKTAAKAIVIEEESAKAASDLQQRAKRLFGAIEGLVGELRATLPEAGQYPYSPLRMVTLVRDTAARYTPDMQIRLLQPFEDMTRDDLVDPDTWKGIAYMMAYSAQFQATKARDMLDERLPGPVKPITVARQMRGGLERITPDIARDMLANLPPASAEDLLKPVTWKEMVLAIINTTQTQAGKTTQALNEQLPAPFKPETILGILSGSIRRMTPETAKQIAASFEGATKEDLLDPETWKGIWYMLDYSLQFQAEQLRQRMGMSTSGSKEEEE